jgi:two-component system CheB/CheR fusion protein
MKSYHFHVVGIGASAGGLEPLKKVVSLIPPGTKAAFVVVQHLFPSHKSQLARILAGQAELPVIRLEEDMAVEQGVIYVLSENKYVTLEDGILRLKNRLAEDKINYAIDIFFKSLAADARDKAVAVVLSGANEDGSEGAKQIGDAGGNVLVQDPDTAQFPTMPVAVIRKDSPEEVRSPQQLIEALLQRIQKTA